jgi:hypothetical protein
MIAPDPVPDRHPKGPNFLLIVILFAVAIVLVLLATYFTIDWTGKRLIPRSHQSHPTSQLIRPDLNRGFSIPAALSSTTGPGNRAVAA